MHCNKQGQTTWQRGAMLQGSRDLGWEESGGEEVGYRDVPKSYKKVKKKFIHQFSNAIRAFWAAISRI